MRWLFAGLFAMLTASSVVADDEGASDGAIVISIEAGRTVRKPVGNATGWFCDTPELVKASIVTEGDINYWVVEGRQVGRTACRVGTDPSRATFVFDVRVTKPMTKSRR